jgi:hypothetical protein
MDEQLNDRLRSYFYAKYGETESSVDTATAAE